MVVTARLELLKHKVWIRGRHRAAHAQADNRGRISLDLREIIAHPLHGPHRRRLAVGFTQFRGHTIEESCSIRMFP
jgi:hypothetical protein